MRNTGHARRHDAALRSGDASACPLWESIAAQGLRTVAVMGMTKNTGKTVCLNHLLAQAHAAGQAVGLTSIGRDGEERDQVFSIPKPPVRVMSGHLIATASDTLRRARVPTRRIGSTGVESPMGEILIVRAMAHGEMEVAGASRGNDQRKVIALLRQCGADLVFLDGALGRSHHASPALADGVVLATGAAIGGGMQDVLRKTRDRLAILGIASASAELVRQVRCVFEADDLSPVGHEGVHVAHSLRESPSGRFGIGTGVGIWHRDGRCLFREPINTVNAAKVLNMLSSQHDGDRIATIAMAGAVGKLTWQAVVAMLSQHPGLTLVVADGTRLFIDAADLAEFDRRGGRLFAMRGIRLIGVALNPFSPFGGSFDAAEFLRQARIALPGQGVTDVMLNPQTRPKEAP